MDHQYHQVGKRKSAIARVYLSPFEQGTILINGRTLENYFPLLNAQMLVMEPLKLTSTVGKFNILINVRGGGLIGKAGAIRHGIAKTLLKADETHRVILKRAGLLTRDARKVERKKYGLAGARRRYQYSKR